MATEKQRPAEPLPCPFCNHVGLEFKDGETIRWGVAYCAGCGASAGDTRRKYPDDGSWHAEAIKQWNSRAALASAPQGAVPAGWSIKHAGDDGIRITAPNGAPGGMSVNGTAHSLPERLLHALARDLLAAAPAAPVARKCETPRACEYDGCSGECAPAAPVAREPLTEDRLRAMHCNALDRVDSQANAWWIVLCRMVEKAHGIGITPKGSTVENDQP